MSSKQLPLPTEPGLTSFNMREKLLEIERRLITRTLKATEGNVSQAALILHMPRVTLISKMRRLNIQAQRPERSKDHATEERRTV